MLFYLLSLLFIHVELLVQVRWTTHIINLRLLTSGGRLLRNSGLQVWALLFRHGIGVFILGKLLSDLFLEQSIS